MNSPLQRKSHRSTPSASSINYSSLQAGLTPSNSNNGLERSPTFGNFDFARNSPSVTGGKIGNSNDIGKELEETQNKTFCRWLNARLGSQYPPLTDLSKDFSDGTRLIQLLEVLTGTSLGRYTPASPSMIRVQKAENVNIALNKINETVKMINIGATDIIDGNRKIILGMIWSLVLRFVIQDISEEGHAAKDGLKLWCQRSTQPYEEVEIANFTRSWQDGLAFCALIDSHRPDLIDYHSLPRGPNSAVANTKLAFKIAEEQLGIPQLLEVEDVCGVKQPDERSVMTYVAEFFHKFSTQARQETDARVIGSFVEYVGALWKGENDYETRANAFRTRMNSNIETISYPFNPTYANLIESRDGFAEYCQTSKHEMMKERLDLKMLLRNIQIKAVTYGLKTFEPIAPIDPASLDSLWEELLSAEVGLTKLINREIRKIRTEVISEYAIASQAFSKDLELVHQRLANITIPSLEEQMAQVFKLDLSKFPSQLSNLSTLSNLCTTYSIRSEDHDHYPRPISSLTLFHDNLLNSIQIRKNFLLNQLTARTKTNVTPKVKEEFVSSFTAFAGTEENVLDEGKLSSALASLGYDPSTHPRIFQGMKNQDGLVSLDSFMDYLKEKSEDRVTIDKLKDSFKNLAGDSPYISEIHLSQIDLPKSNKAATIDFLQTHLFPVEFIQEDGQIELQSEKYFDYEGYLNATFATVLEGKTRPRRSIA